MARLTSPSRKFPKLLTLVTALLLAVAGGLSTASGQDRKLSEIDFDNVFFAMPLEGFFPGEHARAPGPKMLNVYMVRRNGEFTAAVGTATIKGRPIYNQALMPIDPSGLKFDGKRVTGTMDVVIAPDAWIPLDQQARKGVITIDVGFEPPANENEIASIVGTYSAVMGENEKDAETAGLIRKPEGPIKGGLGGLGGRDVSDVNIDLWLHGVAHGESQSQEANHARQRVLSFGVQDHKIVSTRVGMLSPRRDTYDMQEQAISDKASVEIDTDSVRATLGFETDTLDGRIAQYEITVEGNMVANMIAGRYTGTYTVEYGDPQEISGWFRGSIREGAYVPEETEHDDRGWYVDVKGHKPVQPGEHPRLFFRKADVPELQRRAKTPEGQQMIAQLRLLLNGSDGESMPTLFNPAVTDYPKDTEPGGRKSGWKPAPGAYTISHAAGFGFLYQLTGEKKYAEFARECIELAWKGQRNYDPRYSWVDPGGQLRAGPAIGWYAVAYDLCYEAWPEDFRRKVALAIQNYGDDDPTATDNLRNMIFTPRHGPNSNHYGAVVGGCGLAVLAIKGDPGTDQELLERYLSTLERQVVRNLTGGFGDGGYFQEGIGPGGISSDTAFIPFLQALKVAQGRDYSQPRPNADMITMVRVFDTLGPPPVILYRSGMDGTYGDSRMLQDRSGLSRGGQFAQGFGQIRDEFKPALLWFYNNIVEPNPEKRTYDTDTMYPHRPMMALVNWPTFEGIKEKNPADILPKFSRDSRFNYFVFRNGWEGGKNDIVTSVLGNHHGNRPREVMIWSGDGIRATFGEPGGGRMTHFLPAEDGSAVVTIGKWSLAVDYSKASGADALFATIGANPRQTADPKAKAKAKAKAKGKAEEDGEEEDAAAPRQRLTSLEVNGETIHILTLSRNGQHPEPKAQGDKITVGGQTITYIDGNLILGKMAPTAKEKAVR